MTTLEQILAKYNVTDEQISKAHRVEDLNKHQVFYQVESAHDPVEYTVVYDQVHHCLTCTCKAGQEGIGCWHKRAAVAHAEEIRQERIARQEAQMIELAKEMAEEARAHSPYTVVVDPTSSSLDGVTFENGVPMR